MRGLVLAVLALLVALPASASIIIYDTAESGSCAQSPNGTCSDVSCWNYRNTTCPSGTCNLNTPDFLPGGDGCKPPSSGGTSRWSEQVGYTYRSTDFNRTPGGSFSYKIRYAGNEDRGHMFFNPGLFSGKSTIYVRWYEYFATGFDFAGQLKGFMLADTSGGLPRWGSLVQYRSNSPCDTGHVQSILWGDDFGGGDSDYTDGGIAFQMNTGQWYKVALRLVLNTVGQANGTCQMWLNDVMVLNNTSCLIRQSQNTLIGSGWTGGNYSNGQCGGTAPSPTSFRYLDDICFADTQADCGDGVADTTPPDQVTGLTVANVANSRTQLQISWLAANDNSGGSGVTGYKLERCAGVNCPNAAGTADDFAEIATPTGLSYTDSGLDGKTAYAYRVRAVDAATNNGAYSSTVLGATVWPIRLVPGERYMREANGTPWLMIGDTAHAIMQNASISGATGFDVFLASREAKGVNALWIETQCNCYISSQSCTIGCRADGSTQDTNSTYNGAVPYTGGNIATPNNTYWTKMDALVENARQRGIVLLFDLVETGGWTNTFVGAGVSASRTYGQFLGNRYKYYPNIIWITGNDFGQWCDPAYGSPCGQTGSNEQGSPNQAAELAVAAVPLGVKDVDTVWPNGPHLFTVQLDYFYSYSRQHPSWTTQGISTVNLSYSYHPTYDIIKTTYQLSPVVPTFLGEGFYLNNSWYCGPTPCVTDNTVRRQAYWALLSGATGAFWGDETFSQFKPNWQTTPLLESTSTVEIPYAVQFFTSRRWDLLVPDFARASPLVTGGLGTYQSIVSGGITGSVMTNDYATAAVASNGSWAAVYLPTRRTVTINMAQLGTGAQTFTARWYDPSNGTYTTANSVEAGSQPYSNTGTRNFLNPATTNSEGSVDFLLVFDLQAVAATCGNSVTEAGEACDDGNTTTETTCPYQSSGPNTCQRCNANCTAVLNLSGPYCGDGVRTAANETCEYCGTGTPTTCTPTLLNNQTCISQGYAGGTLACAANCVSFNTSACTLATTQNSLMRGVKVSGGEVH